MTERRKKAKTVDAHEPSTDKSIAKRKYVRHKETSDFGLTRNYCDRKGLYVISIIGILSLILLFATFSTNQMKSDKSSTDVKVTDDVKKQITYQDYQELATKFGWQETTPLMRLHRDMVWYCQVAINGYFSGEEAKYESAIRKEILLLLGILVRSKDTSFDLTEIFFDVIDETNQCFYLFTKKILTNTTRSWITRREIEHLTSTWIYFPIYELLNIKMKMLNESSLIMKEYPHVYLDLDVQLGKGGRNAMSLSAYYRFHRVLMVLMNLRADPEGSLLEAVINQDEIAVSILLQYRPVIDLIMNASSKDNQIFTYPQLFPLNPIMSDIFQRANTYWNTSIPFHLLSDSNTTLDSLDEEELFQEGKHQTKSGGFPNCTVSLESKDNDSYVAESHCRFRKISLSLIESDPSRFKELMRRHVSVSTPFFVIDDVGVFESVLKQEQMWSVSGMLASYSQQKILTSSIPYSTVFNERQQRATTIEDFLTGPSGVLKMTEKIYHDLSEAENKLRKNQEGGENLETRKGQETLSSELASNSLDQITDNPPEYFFMRTTDLDQLTHGLHSDLEDIIYRQNSSTILGNLLDILTPQTVDRFQFQSKRFIIQMYLGPILSGAPFHSHGPALNFLIYGKKQWTIFPPSKDIYTSAHPLVWERRRKRDFLNQTSFHAYKSSGCRIEHNQNEILYIPRHWSHQVVNLKASVGFAVEFKDYI